MDGNVKVTQEEAIALAKMAGYTIKFESKYRFVIHPTGHPNHGKTYRWRKTRKKKYWQRDVHDRRGEQRHWDIGAAIMDGIHHMNRYEIWTFNVSGVPHDTLRLKP